MESKFKQGDEVVDILTGDVGVVVGEVIGEDSRAWDVKWKSGKITGSTCWQWEDQLELVGKYGYTLLQQDMQGCNVAASESVTEYTAADMLQEAKDCLVSRGVERDKPDGERSMKSTVEAFNALTGHELTEEHGWIFMVALKMARSQGGCYKVDDYIDMAAYAALAGEAGAKETNNAN